MKRYILSSTQDDFYTIKYSTRNSYYRVGNYSMTIRKSGGKWTVSILDRETLDMESKTYNKKEAINNFTEKFGIHVDF
jgi:hypothetical protein